MGITTYQRCEQIHREVLNQGYEDKIGWHDLANIVRKMAGSNPVTLKTYRKELQMCGFFKTENNVVFEIVKPKK